MKNRTAQVLRPLCGFFFAATALCISGSIALAQDAAKTKVKMHTEGSLVDGSAGIRMLNNDPVVRRQMQLNNLPQRQSITTAQPDKPAAEVRIEIPPSSQGKENTSPFFQFRQLQDSPESSSDGQFLSQEARKTQVERYRQSLVSATD